MATRRQIKRERKRRTHGIERTAPDTAVREPGDPKAVSAKGESRAPARGRNGKVVPYPTIRRALRRAPIFALIWFIAIEFLFRSEGSSTVTNAVTALIIGAIMVPAMYFTDKFAYRIASKRGGQVAPPPSDRRP